MIGLPSSDASRRNRGMDLPPKALSRGLRRAPSLQGFFGQIGNLLPSWVGMSLADGAGW